MIQTRNFPKAKLALSFVAIAVLSGCASVSIEQTLERVNGDASSFTDGNLSLARTDAERERRARAAKALLATPLGQREACSLHWSIVLRCRHCWRKDGPMPQTLLKSVG